MKDYSSDEHENLAWLDLETTGLRPNDDAILEIGIVITDKRLNSVKAREWVVSPSRRVPITEIDSFVFQMHTDNGLWKECFSPDAVDLNRAAIEALEFVEANGAKGSPLCGNTISFDRSFLKAQAPTLNSVFHYRNIDVSTLKNVFKMHFPGIPAYEKPTNAAIAHRAIEDILHSIAEYRHYLEKMGAEL